MAKEDVGKALEAMEDEDVRSGIAGGDFSGVSELSLTDEEKELLTGAAEDYPEVAGFAFNSYLSQLQKVEPQKTYSSAGRFGTAAQYAFGPELKNQTAMGLIM